ncbi:MAG: shikimate dehydrogenase [Trueperaceae bacterium]
MEAARVLLLAHPAGHSLSPLMHGAAFRALGLNATYEAVDVAPADLAAAVARLAEPPFLGANVTVPHKEAVAPLMNELTPAAQAVGAVNTIVRRDHRLVGHNTDGEGFLRALSELAPFAALQPADAGRGAAPDLTGRTCLVLGAGGAARAVVHSLLAAGAAVKVLNRNEARAARLVEDLQRVDADERRLTVCAASDLPAQLSHIDLLVNSTSVGMSGGPEPESLPLLEGSQLALLPPAAVVVDLVYRPALTPLLRAASQRGLVVQNGLPMLVWQGALAFEAWTGSAAPVEVMREAAERGLAGRPA